MGTSGLDDALRGASKLRELDKRFLLWLHEQGGFTSKKRSEIATGIGTSLGNLKHSLSNVEQADLVARGQARSFRGPDGKFRSEAPPRVLTPLGQQVVAHLLVRGSIASESTDSGSEGASSLGHREPPAPPALSPHLTGGPSDLGRSVVVGEESLTSTTTASTERPNGPSAHDPGTQNRSHMSNKPEPTAQPKPTERKPMYPSNRYPGACRNCGRMIGPGQGSRIEVDGKWKVFHGDGPADCPKSASPVAAAPDHLNDREVHNDDGDWGPAWDDDRIEAVPQVGGADIFAYHVPERYAGADLSHHDMRDQTAATDWFERGGSTLLIHGPVGTGKTHFAWATVREMLMRAHVPKPIGGAPTVFARNLAALMAETRPSGPRDGEGREFTLEHASNCGVLILDDVGVERLTEWGSEQLTAIVMARYDRQLPTIVTTNATLDEFRNHVGTRIADRLTERSTTITMTGSNRRREEATNPFGASTPALYIGRDGYTPHGGSIALSLALMLCEAESYAGVMARLNLDHLPTKSIVYLSAAAERKRAEVARGVFEAGFESLGAWRAASSSGVSDKVARGVALLDRDVRYRPINHKAQTFSHLCHLLGEHCSGTVDTGPFVNALRRDSGDISWWSDSFDRDLEGVTGIYWSTPVAVFVITTRTGEREFTFDTQRMALNDHYHRSGVGTPTEARWRRAVGALIGCGLDATSLPAFQV